MCLYVLLCMLGTTVYYRKIELSLHNWHKHVRLVCGDSRMNEESRTELKGGKPQHSGSAEKTQAISHIRLNALNAHKH